MSPTRPLLAFLLLSTVACGSSAGASPDASDAGDGGADGSTDTGGGAMGDGAMGDGAMGDAADDSGTDSGDGSTDGGGGCAAMPLELGTCALPDGSNCTGAADEGGVFVPVGPGDELPMIRGPQGFFMLILAARAAGIAPGDATMPASADNPRVEIHVLDGAGAEQAFYRGRNAFTEDPDAPGRFFNAGLFVIVDPTTTDLVGHEARAVGELMDSAGATRCGELRFTVAAGSASGP